MEEKSTISDTVAGSLAPGMATYDAIAGLPLEVEGYELEAFERPVSSGFVRHTTVVRLRGGGEEGRGEDVTYEADEHERLRSGVAHDLTGASTFDDFSELVGSLDLFPDGPPEVPARRNYRRWAFESAALDLALRQAGTTLAEALGRTPAPVRFVVSRRLPKPPSVEPLRTILDVHPATRFKLDPTSEWTEEIVAELAELDAVEVLDLKGAYRGTAVDQPPDPRLYRLVAEAFPQAVLEDPDLVDPGTAEALESSSRTRQLGRGHPFGGRDRRAAVPSALAQHQAVEVRQLLRALRHVRLLRRPRHHDVRRRSVRALRRDEGRSRRSRRCFTRTGRTTSLRSATTARPWSRELPRARCRRMAQPWAFGRR